MATRPRLLCAALLLIAALTGASGQEAPIFDAHNHDAPRYRASLSIWDEFGVAKVLLFGSISEPDAVRTDRLAWEAYEKYPARFIPFFAGLDPHSEACLAVARARFEQGYFGIGEIVAASSYSPITSKLAWKGRDPMDGYLPRLYELCAEYRSPVLLHIDPPSGYPIARLEEAIRLYPGTIFILAHANAYNSPEALERLLGAHGNLYIDFYAGFTAFDKNSANRLEDFVPLIERYGTRFFVSSDSGSGIRYAEAYTAIRMLLGMLDPETAGRVARGNIEGIIEAEPVTEAQIAAIRKLSAKQGKAPDIGSLNRRRANEYIFANR